MEESILKSGYKNLETDEEFFCCSFFKAERRMKNIVSLDEIYKYPESYAAIWDHKSHPKYMAWIIPTILKEREKDNNYSYGCWCPLNFCPNCGYQYETNENMKAFKEFMDSNQKPQPNNPYVLKRLRKEKEKND